MNLWVATFANLTTPKPIIARSKKMKLDEFKKLIEAQRQEIQLTNLEKIAKIVETTNTKGKN
jgi:hypothetical protein